MKVVVEGFRSAVTQPVSSAIVMLIIAAACATVLATTGRSVSAEAQVLAQIDRAGTRSIVVTSDTGIDPTALERVQRLSGIEWAIGVGRAADTRNSGNPGSNPAAVRALFGDAPSQLHFDSRQPGPGEVVVGGEAQRELGMIYPMGGVSGGADQFAVIGSFHTVEPIAFLNRTLLRQPSAGDDIWAIYIVVSTPEMVRPVASAVVMSLALEDPGSAEIQTSEVLVEVRTAVRGELGRFGRDLVTQVLGAALVLTALAVYGGVNNRRRDFGRRRALGSARSGILILVATQTMAASMTGALLGSATTAAVLWQASGQLPDLRFTVSVVVLAVTAAQVAAVPPALVAAYRDPVRVLRVP